MQPFGTGTVARDSECESGPLLECRRPLLDDAATTPTRGLGRVPHSNESQHDLGRSARDRCNVKTFRVLDRMSHMWVLPLSPLPQSLCSPPSPSLVPPPSHNHLNHPSQSRRSVAEDLQSRGLNIRIGTRTWAWIWTLCKWMPMFATFASTHNTTRSPGPGGLRVVSSREL